MFTVSSRTMLRSSDSTHQAQRSVCNVCVIHSAVVDDKCVSIQVNVLSEEFSQELIEVSIV